jgi:uncharacterized membrane protein YphA (DoxX/SURF4 family)
MKAVKVASAIGRMVFGGFFLYSGINHIRHRETMAQYAGAKGVPQPELAVTLSAVPLLIGGASLILGVKPKIGAMAIIGFLAGVTPVMHDFWANEDPNERQANMIQFMKNLALAAGAMEMIDADERRTRLRLVEPTLVDQIRLLGRRIAA